MLSKTKIHQLPELFGASLDYKNVQRVLLEVAEVAVSIIHSDQLLRAIKMNYIYCISVLYHILIP